MTTPFSWGLMTVARMKAKFLKFRIAQCIQLASLSPCSRRQFGAVIVNPISNSILAEGYNGTPRGHKHDLCGSSGCLRDCVESGTRLEVGCHHAEANCLMNALRTHADIRGSILIVSGEPCLMCAKLIHHSGIEKVFTIQGSYSAVDGVNYLRDNNIEVIKVNDQGDIL